MKYAIRHGEALLYPVREMPKNTKKVKTCVVSHSETGHHHVIESDVEFEMANLEDSIFFSLVKPAKIVHKKSFDAHKTLTVPAGTYKVIYKTEYNPWEKVLQKVFD